jgi:arsenite oxidase small subunit
MREDFMSEAKPKKFRFVDLQQFDGINGRPLYIIFKGKIYDLTESKLWLQGKHMGMHTPSQNLAEALKSAPHGEDNIFRFPIVGELEDAVLPAPVPTPIEKKTITPQAPQPVPPVGMGRRNFLKLAAAAGGAITIAAVASSIKAGVFVPQTATSLQWPQVKVANINQLSVLTPSTFNYPLTNTPNILVKLGTAAQNGVGPDSDIVAYSSICQHLGCQYSFVKAGASPVCNAAYKAAFPMGYCCCHGSQYDFVNRAKVIGGPAPRPVPMVQLQFNAATGDITAVSMGAPTIFGHGPPGTTDPALVMQYDLQGGQVVTQATVLTG